MKHLILFFIFFTALLSTTSVQAKKFDHLTDDILLRVGSYQTNSITQQFLKKYVAFIATKPRPASWTAFPPIENPTPDVLTIHSLVFKKHPFVDIEMQEGRLEMFTREQDAEVVGVLNYRVCFLFNSKKQAEEAFARLCKLYTPVSTSKNTWEKGNRRIAVFKSKRTTPGRDNKNITWDDQVQFILTQDELFDGKYKVLFARLLDENFTKLK